MKDSGYKQIDFLLGYQLGPTWILIVWHDENPIFLAFSLIGGGRGKVRLSKLTPSSAFPYLAHWVVLSVLKKYF
jgi:hypothetical protein